MSFSSPESFWSIVDAPADEAYDRRITQASQDLDLLAIASAYNRSSAEGRVVGVNYYADEIAGVMEKFGLHEDPDAAMLAWDRCRGQK